MPTLAHYMAQYDQEHGSAWNKILHGVGIPMFLAGIFLILLTKWTWGAAFFLGGCVLKEIIPRFSRDRFICWLGQSGSQKKLGCF
jgi:hypothetical protein